MKNRFSGKPFSKMKIKSAQSRVVSACVCFMLVSMLIIGVYSYTTICSKLFEQKSQELQIYSQKTVENLEQVFSFASNTGMAVATSESILEWVDNPSAFDSGEADYYNRLYQLKREIMHILTYSNAWKNDYLSYISVFVNDEMLMYSAAKPMAETAIRDSAAEIYRQAQSLQDAWLNQNNCFLIRDGRIYLVRIMKQIFESRESLAILIAIDEQSLRRQYSERDTMKSYLIDSNGTIFSSSDEEECGKKCDAEMLEAMETSASRVKIRGVTYICRMEPLSGVDLTFLSLTPRSEIIRQAFSGLPVYIAIACILGILLSCIGVVISYRSTSFIRDMAEGMEEIKKKNYDVKMPHYQNEAVDYLSDSFNSMTESMKILVKDTYESKIMLQEMQLEFLQQQVNPHFLFNILLTIQVKAKMCSDENVYQMLQSLSGFLRAGLYFSKNMFTTLGEELKCVQFYLYLQQQRFEERLSYEIQVPEEFRNWEIPRLTVEPMVENAVVHGVEKAENMVTVRITAEKAGEDLEIRIEDDGAGFCTEELNLDDAMDRAGADLEQISREKIGVRNTNSRLKLLYGEKYRLQIQSAQGEGTCVLIRIPPGRRERLEEKHVSDRDRG